MEILSYRGTQIDLSKINQPQIFTNSPCSACRVGKVADKKVWGWLREAGAGEGEWDFLFRGYIEFQFNKVKRILEMEGGVSANVGLPWVTELPIDSGNHQKSHVKFGKYQNCILSKHPFLLFLSIFLHVNSFYFSFDLIYSVDVFFNCLI